MEELKFRNLRNRWKRDTEFVSSATQVVAHPDYQQMIRMGLPAAVLMLREFQQGSTDHFFHALAVITHAQPVAPEHAGNVQAMAKDWVRYGLERGLIE